MNVVSSNVNANDTTTFVPSAYSPSEPGGGARTILPAPFGTTSTDSLNRSGACVGKDVSVGVGLVNGVGDGVVTSGVRIADGVAVGIGVEVGRRARVGAIVSDEVPPPQAMDSNRIITVAVTDQRAAFGYGAL